MKRLFNFCPRCGSRAFRSTTSNLLVCGDCDCHLYRNPAVAVAAIIPDPEGRILLIRRARDPHRGKLSLPGGFVDLEERAEAALHREVAEEVSLKLARITFLCSQTNEYHYRDITYPVLDFFFVGVPEGTAARALDEEVAEVLWVNPGEIVLEEIAFPSAREALRRYLGRP